MAAAIAQIVYDAFNDDEADRLVLIVEPQLLGELRQQLDKPTRDKVVLEMAIHLTQADAKELAQRLTDDGSIGLVR